MDVSPAWWLALGWVVGTWPWALLLLWLVHRSDPSVPVVTAGGLPIDPWIRRMRLDQAEPGTPGARERGGS